MTPALTASILLDLDEHEGLRTLFRRQGHLTINEIAGCCLDRPATSIEARGIAALLKRGGWRQAGRRFIPPASHPIRMAKADVDDRIRLIVGRSDLPEEYHAEVINEIVSKAREWTINDSRCHYVIAKFKKKLAPPELSEDDANLKADIITWLNDPETQALIASRPHRYVTGREIIEGLMMIPDTMMYRAVARVMPWQKTKIRVGDSQIKAYVQPSNKLTVRAAPDLDALPAYLEGRLVAVEAEVLRDVCKLAARQVTHTDRLHVRQAFRALGWKRERSLHGAGWIYIKQEKS